MIYFCTVFDITLLASWHYHTELRKYHKRQTDSLADDLIVMSYQTHDFKSERTTWARVLLKTASTPALD